MDEIDINELKAYIEDSKEQLNMFGYVITFKNILKRTEKLIEVYEKLIKETKEKDEEIKFWKEQVEGYQGLSQQLKEDYNTCFNLGDKLC